MSIVRLFLAPLVEVSACYKTIADGVAHVFNFNCEGIIDSLRSNAKISAALSGSFKLELPGEHFTINPSQLPKNSPTVTHQALGFILWDIDNAAYVAIHLFSVISGLVASSGSIPALRATTDNFMWFLQSISKLWRSLDVWESFPILCDKASNVRVKLLEALVRSVDQVPKSQYGSMKCESLCLFAIRCAGETLKRPVGKTNELTENALARVFLGILFLAEKMPTVNEFLKEQILPLAVAVMNDDGHWAILNYNLKV